MNFETIEEALEYLKSLDQIIMPTQFTYFNHCTSFQAEAIQKNSLIKKSWTQIPVDGFVVKREMSFTERTQRIEEALEYGGKERANLAYAAPKNAKNFIIRVIMPKKNLSLEDRRKLKIEGEEELLLQKEYMGLGDMRHPKLKHNEHILMFACSMQDEVSGTNVDILYGIREQDVIRYANCVREALSIKTNYGPCIIPTTNKVDGQCYYEWDHNYQFEYEIYSIPKEKNFNRYLRRGVIGPSGEIVLYQASEFEQEYINELKKSYTNSTVESVSMKSHQK